MSRRQLFDALKDRVRRQRRPKPEDLIHPRGVYFAWDALVAENRFYFGSKQQCLFGGLGIKEGPHAKSVAGHKQAAVLRVPNRNTPLPVHPFEARRTIFFVQVQNDFCVRRRAKPMPSTFQFSAQLDIVKNFSVENDPERFVLVRDRLAAAADINDAQSCAAQACFLIEQNPKFIRPAMSNHRQHLAHSAFSDGALA